MKTKTPSSNLPSVCVMLHVIISWLFSTIFTSRVQIRLLSHDKGISQAVQLVVCDEEASQRGQRPKDQKIFANEFHLLSID
jgi:hypothetical protein